jgi:hypothetical protein
MPDGVNLIRNLALDDLVKSESEDMYTIIRGGYDLGVFVRIGETYRFRDNQNKTWVCQCTDIDTGATSIEDAVAFMSY